MCLSGCGCLTASIKGETHCTIFHDAGQDSYESQAVYRGCAELQASSGQNGKDNIFSIYVKYVLTMKGMFSDRETERRERKDKM